MDNNTKLKIMEMARDIVSASMSNPTIQANIELNGNGVSEFYEQIFQKLKTIYLNKD